MSIIIFLIILAVLVLVHEFGHFIVAKKSGIRVDEFGLGFPPRILGRKFGGTLYSLNAIPFGGFVKIFGEDSHDVEVAEGDKSRSFQYKPKGIQALVLVAGVTFNLIFAWLVIFLRFIIETPKMPIGALVDSFRITGFLIVETAIGLSKFLYNAITLQADLSQVSGPIGIVSIVSDASSQGFISIISLMALISINLALINLIPFPALDGGRLLFVAIEAIIRRPISPKFVTVTNTVGFALLIILMIVVTTHDIFNLL